MQSEAIANAIRSREAQYEKQGQEIVSGYRIQLYNGKGKRQAIKTKKRFEKAHPDVPAEIVYETPEWKTLVGYYASRDEAARTSYKLRWEFPRLIVRQDAFVRIKLYEPRKAGKS